MRGRFSQPANKGCVCIQTKSQDRHLAHPQGDLPPHSFHTFSDFAFLALCTNLRPSFLAYQIEANIAMPAEIHNESLCTINFPRRLSPADPGWSCHLRAVDFSDPLMLVSQGERGWEEGGVGGKAVLFGRSAGIFTSCQQEVRERRCSLQSRLTHIHLAKCRAAVPRLQTPCV